LIYHLLKGTARVSIPLSPSLLFYAHHIKMKRL
jgi:hypothetical protein